MSLRIRRVAYFYTTLRDRPGEAYRFLAELATSDVHLHAFGAMPLGPDRSQLTIFPERVEKLAAVAERIGLVLDGPYPAILVQGDAKLESLAAIHERLYGVKINVYASTGVTDGEGQFGYLVYVAPNDIEAALAALERMH